MRASGGCWNALDLRRTADVGAIRKAYAKRLKQIDVEADPAGFIALREALEAALSYARNPPPSFSAEPFEPVEPAPPGGHNDLTAPILASAGAEGLLTTAEPCLDSAHFQLAIDAAPASTAAEPAAPPPPGVAVAFSPVQLAADGLPDGNVAAFAGGAPADEFTLREARFQYLQELLFGEIPPDPAEIGGVAAAILADPEMTNLKYAASVEAWIAETICAASPRSDPVIAAAVPCFRWDEDFGRLDQPSQVGAIMERWRGLLFLDHVSRPGHPYHRAWRELTRTDDESLDLGRWLMANKVRSLLTVIREKYPVAESGLDPYRVALWDDRLYGEPQWLNAWGIGAMLFFPPAAVFLAFAVRNPAWFRGLVVAWAILWTIGNLTR